MVSVGRSGHRVVTVPQHALQLAGHQAVVLVPEAVRRDVSGGSVGAARPSYEVSPVLALPPRITSNTSQVITDVSPHASPVVHVRAEGLGGCYVVSDQGRRIGTLGH